MRTPYASWCSSCAPASKLNRARLAGHAARDPCLCNVHRDRGRCRSDPCRLPRGGRAVGHGRAATAVPRDHRPREGSGMRPHHCRLAAGARVTMPGDAAASWQDPLKQACRSCPGSCTGGAPNIRQRETVRTSSLVGLLPCSGMGLPFALALNLPSPGSQAIAEGGSWCHSRTPSDPAAVRVGVIWHPSRPTGVGTAGSTTRMSAVAPVRLHALRLAAQPAEQTRADDYLVDRQPALARQQQHWLIHRHGGVADHAGSRMLQYRSCQVEHLGCPPALAWHRVVCWLT